MMADNRTHDTGQVFRLGLMGILLLALGVRLWGIRNGLPDVFQPHEHWEVNRALRLAAGGIDLDPRTLHKGGYFYLLAFEYGLYFLGLRAAHVVAGTHDFALAIVRDPSPLWLIGRATTACLGTLTVALTAVVARRLHSAAAGLAAAILLALAPLHVHQSRLVTVDVPMTLLVTAAFAILCLGTSRRRILAAAVVLGLAMATKFTAMFMAAAFAVVLVGEERQAGEPIRRAAARLLRRRDTWLAAAAALAVYLVLTPAALVHLDLFARFFRYAARGTGQALQGVQGFDGSPGDDLLGAAGMYAAAMANGLGWPGILAAAGGLAAALGARGQDGRRRAALAALAFVVVLYAVLSASRLGVRAPRYVLPALPLLAIYGGRGIALAAAALARRGRPAAVAAVLAAAAVGPGAVSIAREAAVLGRADTRVLARRWVEEHVPAGSRILLQGNPGWRADLTLPLEDRPDNLVRQRCATDDPGKVCYLGLRLAARREPSYDLVPYGYDDSVPALDELIRDGVEYVAVESKQLGGQYASHFLTDREIIKVGSSRRRLFGQLRSDPRCALVCTIPDDGANRPGPAIDIFKLEASGGAGNGAAAD